eukprot:7373120-Prymnesium_polylepis.1
MVEVDPCEAGKEHRAPLFRVGGKCLTVRRLREFADEAIFKAAGQKGRTGAQPCSDVCTYHLCSYSPNPRHPPQWVSPGW